MLSFKEATKGYGEKKAINNLSADFERGKVYALVGPNGSGKSTMMKVAAGLVKLTSGSCTFNETPICTQTKSKIAYMSTEAFYYDFMKIKHVKKFYTDFFADFNTSKFNELLNFMDLNENLSVKALSSGMAAKLKIAVTLSRDAEIIMLDEPLNGIDLIGRDQIINSIIRATNPNATFIISSHLFDELEPIVDNVIMIKDGGVIISGELEEIRLRNGKSISDLYREVYGNNQGLSDEVWGKKNA